MKVIRIVLWSVAIYFGSWTGAYLAIMGGDFRYFFWYLNLAWTGQAGELPGFMQVAALGSVFVFWLFAIVVNVRRNRQAAPASR
jgi:hypothetical protein